MISSQCKLLSEHGQNSPKYFNRWSLQASIPLNLSFYNFKSAASRMERKSRAVVKAYGIPSAIKTRRALSGSRQHSGSFRQNIPNVGNPPRQGQKNR
jgi:hypothetical protein